MFVLLVSVVKKNFPKVLPSAIVTLQALLAKEIQDEKWKDLSAAEFKGKFRRFCGTWMRSDDGQAFVDIQKAVVIHNNFVRSESERYSKHLIEDDAKTLTLDEVAKKLRNFLRRTVR